MVTSYGLPYKGSKSRYAERIVSLLPPSSHFYDLFCGGCAISHRAMMTHKYEYIHMNDLNPNVAKFFLDCVEGKYKDERRIIDRQQFDELKNCDPLVSLVWSFSNNGDNYLWSEDYNEDLKIPAAHIVLEEDVRVRYEWWLRMADTMKRLVRTVLEEYAHHEEWKENARRWKLTSNAPDSLKEHNREKWELGMKKTEAMKSLVDYFIDAFEKSGRTKKEITEHLGNGMVSHYFTRGSQWELPKREHYARLQQILPDLTAEYDILNDTYKSLKVQFDYLMKGRTSAELALESLEKLDSVTRLLRLKSLEQLKLEKAPILTSLDYRDVEILPDSVIYCDIPYVGINGDTRNTDYQDGRGGISTFDHEEFYRWAESQKNPVFISSYTMPTDRFKCIAEFKGNRFGGNSSKQVIERVFIPIGQDYKPQAEQMKLF